MVTFIEAVRRLRGDCERQRQVKDSKIASVADAGGQILDSQGINDITLKDFLIELSNKYNRGIRELLFDSTEEQLKPNHIVLLNGKHWWSLANKIHTKLNNGDAITIFPPLTGG